jgi:WD40 repeat protein
MTLKSFFHSRRNIVIALSLAGVLCIASIVVLFVMYDNQRKIAKELNENLLLNESRELAFHGELMLKEGRLADAEKLALSILPKDLSNPDRPYSVDAERLLRNCHFHRESSPLKLKMDGHVVGIDEKYAYSIYERYDLQSGQVERLCPEDVVEAELAPDFKTLIYQCDSTLYVMDVNSGESRSIYQIPSKEFIEGIQFDQMGTRAAVCLASYNEDGSFCRALYVYEVDGCELVDLHTRDMYESDELLVTYSFSNDGRWLAEFYVDPDENGYCIGMWDLTDYSWKSSWTIDGFQLYNAKKGVEIYAANNSLLVGGSNISSDYLPLIGGLGSVISVDIDKYTGDMVILHEDYKENQYVSVYDKDCNKKVSIITYSDEVCAYASSNVICLYNDYVVNLYDAKTLEELVTLYSEAEIYEIHVSEDCKKLLLDTENGYMLYDLSNYIVLGDVVVEHSEDYFMLSNGEVRDARNFELLMTVPAAQCASIRGDHLALLQYGDTDTLQVYDLKSHERKYTSAIKMGGYSYNSIKISSDGRYLIYDGSDGEEVMDLSTGEIICDLDEWLGLDFCADDVHVHGMSYEDPYNSMELVIDLNSLDKGSGDDVLEYAMSVSDEGEVIVLGEESVCQEPHDFKFSDSDEFFLTQTQTGVRVYETSSWKVVFDKEVQGLNEAHFVGDSYLSVSSSGDEEMLTEVYQIDGWKQVYTYNGYYPVFKSPYPLEDDLSGDIADVFCLDDSKVGVAVNADPDYGYAQKFLVWDKTKGEFVLWSDIYDCGEMEVYVTGNGDLILSSYTMGIRKVDMPDLQTLIDQARARYGM